MIYNYKINFEKSIYNVNKWRYTSTQRYNENRQIFCSLLIPRLLFCTLCIYSVIEKTEEHIVKHTYSYSYMCTLLLSYVIIYLLDLLCWLVHSVHWHSNDTHYTRMFN